MKKFTHSSLIGVAVAGFLAGAALLSSCEKQSVEAEAPATEPNEAPESVEKPEVTPPPKPEAKTEKETPPASAKPVADVTSEEAKEKAEKTPMKQSTKKVESGSNLEMATLAGGCFWCTEAVLEKVEGVEDVVSGYMGGHVDNPTYDQICTKTTGHAEVIQVTFDTTKLSFEDILDIFWQAHDPTTLNQQGNDRGPQYRSAIFYHTPQQKNIAEQSKDKLDASGTYSDPAVTEITAADTFWVAEDYHQNYYELNKDKNPYCRIVITPKMKKFGFE